MVSSVGRTIWSDAGSTALAAEHYQESKGKKHYFIRQFCLAIIWLILLGSHYCLHCIFYSQNKSKKCVPVHKDSKFSNCFPSKLFRVSGGFFLITY